MRNYLPPAPVRSGSIFRMPAGRISSMTMATCETPQEAVHGKNPITLNIKPMKYGENIRTGEMKSRVIIVVNNN